MMGGNRFWFGSLGVVASLVKKVCVARGPAIGWMDGWMDWCRVRSIVRRPSRKSVGASSHLSVPSGPMINQSELSGPMINPSGSNI